jgi:hypothetical protein
MASGKKTKPMVQTVQGLSGTIRSRRRSELFALIRNWMELAALHLNRMIEMQKSHAVFQQ